MGLVAALGGAGCGSDDDDDNHGTTQTAGTAGTAIDDDDDNDNATAGKSSVDDDDDNDNDNDNATGGKSSDDDDDNDVTTAGGPGDDDDDVTTAGGPGDDDDDVTTAGGPGDDDDDTATGGTGDDDDDTTTGGKATGGKSSTGGASGDDDDDTATGGTGDDDDDTTTGGTAPTAEIEDVITSMCGWEFKCCDSGELNYRMSPFIGDAAECVDVFTYELRESNGTSNPYMSGAAAGLLGTLGYLVDLDKVEVNADGVAACAAQWDDLACNTWIEPDPNARCTAEANDVVDPCSLANLFKPALSVGDECTLALAEAGPYNDIECPVGSTCLAAGHADNPNDFPTCVSRGLAGQHCTQDDDCDHNFYCADGDCAAKGAVGDTCSFNDPDHPAPGDEDAQCEAGLACNPVTLKCVAPCTRDYVCAVSATDNDYACPAGYGCAPIEVDEGTDEFRACKPVGTTAAALCNSHADCAENMYCDGEKCQNDLTLDDPCSSSYQCATGLFCDAAACASYLGAGDDCTTDEQCGPESEGCLNIGDPDDPPDGDDYVCRTTLLSNGTRCGEDRACTSGRCEFANTAATYMTCVTGADEGDDCDDDRADGDAQRCGPGLLCYIGECIAQAEPGTSCIDPDENPNSALCANGSTCTEAWQGETEMCSDMAVAKTNGGSGVQCDGGE